MKTVQELKKNNKKAYDQLRANYGTRRLTARKEGYPDGNSEDLTKLFVLLYKKNSVDQNELFNNAKKLIFTLKDQKEIQKLLDTNLNLLENKLIKKILKKKTISFSFTKIIMP